MDGVKICRSKCRLVPPRARRKLALASLTMLGCVSCASTPSSPPNPGGTAGPGAPPAGLFLSPMGEPFRAPGLTGVDLISHWFAGADRDGDGFIRLQEMETDAARFFASLDVDGDGEIEPSEITRYESEIAPEIRLGGRMGRGFGGAPGGEPRGPGARPGGPPGGRGGGPPRGFGGRPRPAEGRGRGMPFALLDFPQPVTAADSDFNRGVSQEEFRRAAGQRFVRLDRTNDGALDLEELRLLRPDPRRRR